MRLHIRALLRQTIILTRRTRRRFAQIDFKIAPAAQPFEQWIDRTFRGRRSRARSCPPAHSRTCRPCFKRGQHAKPPAQPFLNCVFITRSLSGGARRLFLKAEPAVHGLAAVLHRVLHYMTLQHRRFPQGFCRTPCRRGRIRACADFCKLHAARGLRSSRAAPHRQTSVRPPLLLSKIRHVAASWQPPKSHVKRAAPPAPESASQAGAACRPPFKCRQACVPLSDG